MIQLRELISSIVNSFLGPNKNNKFLIQDKDFCITRCPLFIFQSVHFQNPVMSLVEETLFAHHDLYGCSTLSLLAMWHLWNEEFRLAIDEGCKVQDIIKHSQIILDQVIIAISDTIIKFDTMISKRQNPIRKSYKTLKISKQVPMSIQYSSRHFSPAQNFLNFEDYNKFYGCSEMDESCLKRAVQCLNHDENAEISDLILKCWKRQISSSSSSKFSADGILVCPIVLPCSSSTVVDGLILKSYLNYSCCLDMKNTYSNRSLLIKGSITYEYIHLGFSPKVNILVQQTSSIMNKEIWINKICEFINQLNLDILLIKDDIEPKIASFCLAHSILVLPHIPMMLFKKICNTLQYSPCTYVMDCTEEDIIKNLIVKLWRPEHDVMLNNYYFTINIDSGNMVKLQTILLCHPCQAVLESTEHQLHHLIARLNLCFESNALLPGEGLSEKWCSEFLHKLPQFHDISDPTSRIMKALADGFRNYATKVSKKKLLCNDQELKILDEMSSKFSAWRSALSLLLLTFQCHSGIINGADDVSKVCNTL